MRMFRTFASLFVLVVGLVGATLAQTSLAAEDFASLPAATTVASPSFPVCYVCGTKTKAVTKPENKISFPGHDAPISCGRLEYGGLNGFVDPSHCPILSVFKVAKICGCEREPKEDAVTTVGDIKIRQAQEEMGEDEDDDYDNDSSEEAAISLPGAPIPDFPTCYVCGSKSQAVTGLGNEITFPGQETPISCEKLEYGGLNGFWNPSYCSLLSVFKVSKLCGCAPKDDIAIDGAIQVRKVSEAVTEEKEVLENDKENYVAEASPPASPLSDFPICYVCGSKTLAVTKPENEVTFPGQDTPITCEKLEFGGLNGFVNPSYCPLLSVFKVAKICGCVSNEEIASGEDITSRQATETFGDEDNRNESERAAVPALPEGPIPDFPACYVCGSKKLVVTKPENKVTFPGQEAPMSCDKLEYGGLNGFLDPSYCPLLPLFKVAKICECAPKDEVDKPIGVRGAKETVGEQLNNTNDGGDVDHDNDEKGKEGTSEPEIGVGANAEENQSQGHDQVKESAQEKGPESGSNSTSIAQQAPDNADLSPGYPVCLICGSKTMVVTKPDSEVPFPGVEKPIPCYKLDYGGLNGFISPDQCPVMAFFKVPKICGCSEANEDEIKEKEGEDEAEAVESVSLESKAELLGTGDKDEDKEDDDGVKSQDGNEPKGEPVKAPSTLSKSTGHPPIAPSPSPGFPVCYICGSATKEVTKPDAAVTFPGVEKPVPCYKLEYGGLNGFISPSNCPMLRFFKVPKICGCAEATEAEIKELEAEHEAEAIESVPKEEAAENGTQANSTEVVAEATKSREGDLPPTDENEESEGEDQDEATSTNEVGQNEESEAKDQDEATSTKEEVVLDEPDDADVHGEQDQAMDSPGYPVCHVCGTAKLAVTRPHIRVTLPGQKPIRCSKLEFGGLNGYINPTICPTLMNERVPEICGCEPIAWNESEVKEEGEDNEERDDSE